MRNKNKGKQNGYTYTNISVKRCIDTYTNISVKRCIDKNEFVKNIRKQLIAERIKKSFSN